MRSVGNSFLMTVWRRADELRLGQAAASLSFSWLLAMVPLITVSLALVTSFPIFDEMRVALQKLIVQHFLPDGVGSQLSRYLEQFVRKAASLSLVGFVFLALTATVMMLTLDKTLNLIWQVSRPRAFLKRLLIYWAAIIVGPLAAGAGTAGLSWLASGHVRLFSVGGMAWWDWMNLLLTWLTYGLCYRYLPNTTVLMRHAMVGALFAAVLTESAQQLFGSLLGAMPTYRQVYGPLAAVPLLLIWTYLSWWLFLLGALMTASMPTIDGASASMRRRTTRAVKETRR
ncbi:MAG: YihY family inner membrane protein [Betaproteobacteria bacterium]|nr:YihY family inner membrane protein [Betaproteobacteria bacterium]